MNKAKYNAVAAALTNTIAEVLDNSGIVFCLITAERGGNCSLSGNTDRETLETDAAKTIMGNLMTTLKASEKTSH